MEPYSEQCRNVRTRAPVAVGPAVRAARPAGPTVGNGVACQPLSARHGAVLRRVVGETITGVWRGGSRACTDQRRPS